MIPSPSSAQLPSLADLEALPYINAAGQIPESFQGQVGIYAIFDADHSLQYVGYSRDIYASLSQHLVRQPHHCHWFKAHTIQRLSRSVLEDTRQAWIEEHGQTPPGNGEGLAAWSQPMDVRQHMNAAEQAELEALVDLAQIKYLKQTARRLEAEILAQLEARGVRMSFRFNPKLKEKGLLDLK